MHLAFRVSLLAPLKLLSGLAAIGCCMATPASALTLDYWDFNNSDNVPSIGAGFMQTQFSGGGVSVETYSPGSLINAQGSTVAGEALTYTDPVTVFSNHKIRLNDLDFTGMTDVTLSFATLSDQIVQIGEIMRVGYNAGSGFVPFQTLSLPTASFSLRTVDFAGVLDGLSNVSIGIHTRAIFELGSFLKFDNITASAVPEPGTGFLVTAALTAGIVSRRSRRTVAAGY